MLPTIRQLQYLKLLAEHGALDAKMVEQRQQVSRRVPVAERSSRRSSAVATLIPCHHPELRRHRLYLRREHRLVHQEPVAEHDDRPIATSVGVVDLGPIKGSIRHKPEATARACRPEVLGWQARQPAGARRPRWMLVVLNAAIATAEVPPYRQNAPVPHEAGRMARPGTCRTR